MRASRFLIATAKEMPADAEVVSHRLMVRAGLVRQLAAGVYTWLPLGLRVLRRVEAVLREEMNRAGAQELSMPMVQPAELWRESRRWEEYGVELLRLKDRHERDFCLGPTHEEVITELARAEIRSYRQLPLSFYQIQSKFRDEIRPRFGVMRAREFVMKDAYSFHLDQASLQETYERMHEAYSAIFTRLGLEFRAVIADSGSIGGSTSHEFQVLAESGEDVIAFSDASDYAANIEMAEALAPAGERPAPGAAMEMLETPGCGTIDAVCEFLKLPKTRALKTLVVEGEEAGGDGAAGKSAAGAAEGGAGGANAKGGGRGDGGAKGGGEGAKGDGDAPPVVLILRGDHQLNPVKAAKLPGIASPLRFASEGAIRRHCGAGPGSLGPVGLDIPVIVDRAAAQAADFCCGANKDGHHFVNANWERDCPLRRVEDLRFAETGDPSPDGNGRLVIKRGIEVGHIFQLGAKYSEAMQATVLDETGRSRCMLMGCYGIGAGRVVAAAIEQHHDERGILWPPAMAPFQLAIVPLNMDRSKAVAERAESLYERLCAQAVETLLDDRAERPGVKFADMELIGIPHRIVVSERNLKEGKVEYQARADAEPTLVPQADIEAFLKERLAIGQ